MKKCYGIVYVANVNENLIIENSYINKMSYDDEFNDMRFKHFYNENNNDITTYNKYKEYIKRSCIDMCSTIQQEIKYKPSFIEMDFIFNSKEERNNQYTLLEKFEKKYKLEYLKDLKNEQR